MVVVITSYGWTSSTMYSFSFSSLGCIRCRYAAAISVGRRVGQDQVVTTIDRMQSVVQRATGVRPAAPSRVNCVGVRAQVGPFAIDCFLVLPTQLHLLSNSPIAIHRLAPATKGPSTMPGLGPLRQAILLFNPLGCNSMHLCQPSPPYGNMTQLHMLASAVLQERQEPWPSSVCGPAPPTSRVCCCREEVNPAILCICQSSHYSGYKFSPDCNSTTGHGQPLCWNDSATPVASCL